VTLRCFPPSDGLSVPVEATFVELVWRALVEAPLVELPSAEDLLRAVAAELGLGEAVELLAGERARIREMFSR
jgi:hypothetical protein